ncbi:MAG: hypothetical protein HYZ25_18940 [Chloroflexi bacterium]|nr:hypothetical protein [Chloroflexota bacterium]
MFAIPVFDVAGPGVVLLVVGMGLLALCILTALIVVAEAAVLFFLKWGTFKRSLLASLVMNLVTTLIGGGLMFLLSNTYLGLLVDFLLSVLIEGGVLLLFNRETVRKNWIAALAANAVSYLLILLPAVLIFR